MRPFLFVAFIGLAGLGDTPHCHLRREIEPGSQLPIVQPLQKDLVGGLTSKGLTCQPIRRGVEGAECGLQGHHLVLCGQKTGLQSQLHMDSIDNNIHNSKGLEAKPALSLPGLNAGASRANLVTNGADVE